MDELELEILEELEIKSRAIVFIGKNDIYECDTDDFKHLFNKKMTMTQIEQICQEEGFLFSVFIEEKG